MVAEMVADYYHYYLSLVRLIHYTAALCSVCISTSVSSSCRREEYEYEYEEDAIYIYIYIKVQDPVAVPLFMNYSIVK